MRASINFVRRNAARTPVILLAVLLMTACSSAAAAAQEAPTAAPTLAAALPIPQQPAAPPAETQATVTQAAAACTSPAAHTIGVTEGPYFKANSPERASLIEPGMAGTQLTLSGYVLTSDCKPVAQRGRRV
jgi:hypothetical protein